MLRSVNSAQMFCGGRSRTAIALLALCGGLFAASTATAGLRNGLMDISADGKLLACSNRDSGTVTIVDLGTRQVLHEVAVGHKPEGVTFVGDSHQLAVAVYADDKIAFLDGDAGKTTGQVDVFDEPYGLVSTPEGSAIYVTLEYPGEIWEIDPAGQKVARKITNAGAMPRGLALDPKAGRLYVTEYLTAKVKAIDVGPATRTSETSNAKIVDVWEPASGDNLARQVLLHPTRPKLYVPHIRSKVTANHGAGSIFPYVTVYDTRTDREDRRNRIPMDSFRSVLVTANPWACDISPDGKAFVVVFGGTDDMFVCDVVDDDYRELTYGNYLQTGRNPRDVRFSPDGEHFYIYNALDFNVTQYSTKSQRKLATIRVCDNPLSEEIWRGKVLFYSANQPMASRRWISCSSCHPDGDSDGRVWHNPEGLRNTQPLGEMAWTHPIHWSADRDEVQDFEHTIRGQLMQGRGLHRGRLNESLAAPNKGLSADLDALAAYSNTHKLSLSPHAKNGLSEAAKRGKELFFSKSTNCASCHSGPYYSDSQPGGKFNVHDVGTGIQDKSELMGPKYDTPTLLGVYRSAPYLHHGTAATLTDVLTTQNADDKHGNTSHLSEKQVADLVEFLKALPYEDPEPAGKAAGLVKTTR